MNRLLFQFVNVYCWHRLFILQTDYLKTLSQNVIHVIHVIHVAHMIHPARYANYLSPNANLPFQDRKHFHGHRNQNNKPKRNYFVFSSLLGHLLLFFTSDLSSKVRPVSQSKNLDPCWYGIPQLRKSAFPLPYSPQCNVYHRETA